jgi:hypothetical protein
MQKVSFTPWPLYSPGNTPGTHLTRESVGTTANMNAVAKRKKSLLVPEI